MGIEYLGEFPGVIDLPRLRKVWGRREGEQDADQCRLYSGAKNIATETRINRGRVEIKGEVSAQQKSELYQHVTQLKNWRKGPFELFGLFIDAEWRSDLKWQRLAERVGPLDGQVVLDIGCNNGYFMYRMQQAGAKCVLGIDPIRHFKYQFEFIQSFARVQGLHYELFGIAELSAFREVFDSIFSLGILYHHPHPLQQLMDIYDALRPGGKLVLETIGLKGDDPSALCPPGRYAQMKNVWFIPTLPTLLHWMKQARFRHIEVIATDWEGVDEQRSTPWSASASYRDFLHPDNSRLTFEGHPAPLRFIVAGSKAS